MRSPIPTPADLASTDAETHDVSNIIAPVGTSDLNTSGTETAGADHSSLQHEHGAQATDGPRQTSNDRQDSPVCCVSAQAYKRTGNSHTEPTRTARGPVFLDIEVNGYPATAMLDSGCSRNFISADFCTMMGHKPRLKKRANRFPVELANGDRLASSTMLEQAMVTFKSQPGQGPCLRDPQDLDVLPGLRYDVLLGMPWLRRHNPTIDWSLGTIQLAATSHVLRAVNSAAVVYTPVSLDNVQNGVGEQIDELQALESQLDWLIEQNQWVSSRPDLVTVVIRPSDQTSITESGSVTHEEPLHPVA